MNLTSDLRTIWKMASYRSRGATHQDRLQNFYGDQASDYDRFRKKLLKGRAELFAELPWRASTQWIDLGSGTGSSLDMLPRSVSSLKSACLVDLTPSLIDVARQRIQANQWTNVQTVCQDVTNFKPEQAVQIVTCSYSLTMVPNWFDAIDSAWRMLETGGTLGVVDFYVGRRHAAGGRPQHSWFTRHFWPIWFAQDDVHLNSDLLEYLISKFETVSLVESFAPVPYMLGLNVPYFRFIGRKR